MEKISLAPIVRPLQCDIYFGFSAEVCHAISKQGAILVDANIANTIGAKFQNTLDYELIPIPHGKTREIKQLIEDELFKRKLGRDSVIVAIGGGATTDLSGFIAATYMRGVPLVLVPTTLLAMVDAAVGGKTGVDTPFGKNTVGCLCLPKAIFIDTSLIADLPEKEMKNGMAEILKYGLVDNEDIWKRCGNWQNEIEFLIREGVACKKKIIEKDFNDQGLRRILNFGHTVGQGLELIFEYKIAHGEAVAIGCMAESYLSYLMGYLEKEILEQILNQYRKLGYALKKFDPKALLNAMTMDKKAKEGLPRFVLIDRIGHAMEFEGQYCRTADGKELEKMITWMNHG